MRIGLSYDLKKEISLNNTGSEDALEEYDSAETVEFIASALEIDGDSVIMLGGGREFIDNIVREKVDIVFNIAEGRGNYRSREAQLPSILEMLDIPYSGSDPQCLATCLDKPLTKKLVETAGVCTPKWQVISDRNEIHQILWNESIFPAVVKPAYEGSSKGVRLTSVVNNSLQMEEQVTRLLKNYHQPVLVEQYITGEEITVGMVGNSPPDILGIMRVIPRTKEDHFIYSLEVKRDYLNLVDYECPARLKEDVLDKIKKASFNVFQVLGCRDFARLDFRISTDGTPYFIEINPLPGLGAHSDLVIMAVELGWTHKRLVKTVFDAALKRCQRWVAV